MTTLFIILLYFIIGAILGSLFIVLIKIPEGTACVYLVFMLFFWPIILCASIYNFIKKKLKS